MSKFEAVIFDMDGTLLNSEEFAFGVWTRALEEFGFQLVRDTFISMVGTSLARSNQILVETFGPTLPMVAVREKKKAIEMLALETEIIETRSGAIELLEVLREKKVKVGLATSTEQDRAMKRLESGDMLKYFEYILCGDEVKNQKPDPEIYLTMAEMLGVDIEKTLIIEDSPSGVQGALNAGATVYWFKDLADISDELKLRVKSISSMSEVLIDF